MNTLRSTLSIALLFTAASPLCATSSTALKCYYGHEVSAQQLKQNALHLIQTDKQFRDQARKEVVTADLHDLELQGLKDRLGSQHGKELDSWEAGYIISAYHNELNKHLPSGVYANITKLNDTAMAQFNDLTRHQRCHITKEKLLEILKKRGALLQNGKKIGEAKLIASLLD